MLLCLHLHDFCVQCYSCSFSLLESIKREKEEDKEWNVFAKNKPFMVFFYFSFFFYWLIAVMRISPFICTPKFYNKLTTLGEPEGALGLGNKTTKEIVHESRLSWKVEVITLKASFSWIFSQDHLKRFFGLLKSFQTVGWLFGWEHS